VAGIPSSTASVASVPKIWSRGHLKEYGIVSPNGPVRVGRLAQALERPESAVPGAVIALCQMLLEHIATLSIRACGV
jgi:hypothetical protein